MLQSLILLAALAGQAGPQSNPEPWETVVRLKVPHTNHPKGWAYTGGTGTVISSTDKEAIVLTCGHIFEPGEETTEIQVDLFSGKMSSEPLGTNPRHLRGVKKELSTTGTAIGFDRQLDVALVRIKTTKRLKSSPVGRTGMAPVFGQHLRTMGCYLGQDPTLLETVVATADVTPNEFSKPNDQYRGTECQIQPATGRSGSGLFNDAGYLVGVCNFHVPNRDSGVYAALQSIHSILDRFKLSHLYRD
jgi:Trypsin-like peptidase domain